MAETSDMSKPHAVERRFYFNTRADAIAARKALVARKYQCERVIKCDWNPAQPWYLAATQIIIPTADAVDMEALAAQFNGVCDGWETGNASS